MGLADSVAQLGQFERRGPGTDAERRAAVWLAGRLRASGREAEVETVWVRPHEAAALALHSLLAVGGSVLAAFAPLAGVAVLAAALVSLVLDLIGRLWLLRRLTFRRATQNVVSPAPPRLGAEPEIRLVVTAAYDAGRAAIARRDSLARLAARARARVRGRLPGWRGALAIATVLALGASAGRVVTEAQWVAIVQLVPTVGLLVALALLVDAAASELSPGASAASAVAVALALVEELDEAPPRRLAVEVLLAGAGTGPALGARDFVRSRRRSWRPEDTVVLHIEPCARGTPRWWVADGPLLALRFHPRLVALAEGIAEQERHLDARPHTGHGVSGGHAARARGWPAIVVGCLEGAGWAPGRDQPADTAETIDPAAMRGALELCLALVDELDADLALGNREAAR